MSEPLLTIVMPARDAGATIGAALAAILRDRGDDYEVIVVDDGSTDDTSRIAARDPVRVLSLGGPAGVCAARNRGAEAARAAWILFVDADVDLAPDALARARVHTAGTADAVIGCYDDVPEPGSLVASFKHLAQHVTHRSLGAESDTFWSACGLVRKSRFLAVGGFDADRYRVPSIEDIELGRRLRRAGATIRFDGALLCHHRKRWTLGSLVATDVLRRAIPWTVLSLEGGGLPDRLNLGHTQRVAAIVAVAATLLLLAAPFVPAALVPLAGTLGLAAWLNRGLYGLFARRGGARLLVAGFVLQQVYYLYSLAGLALGVVVFLASRRRARG